MIVCIPSKGRPDTKTYKLFESSGFKVIHFVEPQDYDSYKVDKVSIEKDDQGLTYCRNFILAYAKTNGLDWIWVCDDDITQFGRYDGKTKKTTADELHRVAIKAKQLPFEVVGINSRAFAWTAKKAISINSKCPLACVLLNVQNIHWEYAENTKEDIDFCLQAIEKGNGIMRFNHIFFDTPVVGTNKGGLHDWYATKKDAEASKALSLKWSPWVVLKVKPTRLDIKVDVKGFALNNCRRVI